MGSVIQLRSNAQTVQRRDRRGRDSKAQDHNGAHALSAAGSAATSSAAFLSVARDAIMLDILAVIATIKLVSQGCD